MLPSAPCVSPHRRAPWAAVLASLNLLPLLAGCSSTTSSLPSFGALPIAAEATAAAATEPNDRTRAGAPAGSAVLAEARALRRAGDKKAAFELVETAAAKSSDRGLLAEGGLLALEVGAPGKAEALLKQAHDPAKPDWRVVSGLGVAASAQGRHEEAKRHFKTALALAPGQPSVLNNMAVAHVLEKQPGEAQSMLKEAAKSAPKSAHIKQNLALAKDLTGRFEGAGDASKPPPAAPAASTPAQPPAPAAVPTAPPPVAKKPAVAAPAAPADPTSEAAPAAPATAAAQPASPAAWSLSSLLPAVAPSAAETPPVPAPRERVARVGNGTGEGQ